MARTDRPSATHDNESEMSLLGALLANPRDPEILAAVARVSEEDFAARKHSDIYRAIKARIDRGEHIDRGILASDLEAAGKLEGCGGITYLRDEILDWAVHSASIHADRVLDRAKGRQCLSALRRGIELLEGPHPSSSELVERVAKQVKELAESVARKDWTTLHQAMAEELKRIADARDGKTGVGLPTGYVDLDKQTLGMHPGDLIILAAETGGGKSSLAHSIAAHAIGLGKSVMIFSMEMSRSQIVQRMLAGASNIPATTIRTGQLNESQWPKLDKAMQRLDTTRSAIDDSPSLTIQAIRSKCARRQLDEGLDLVIVDYVQLALPEGNEHNREREVAGLSRGLKGIAKDFGVPVLALSQLNDDGRVRESRALKHDADSLWVATIGRNDGIATGSAEVEVQKQRMGPAPVRVHLTWDVATASFRNSAKGF